MGPRLIKRVLEAGAENGVVEGGFEGVLEAGADEGVDRGELTMSAVIYAPDLLVGCPTVPIAAWLSLYFFRLFPMFQSSGAILSASLMPCSSARRRLTW